MRAFMLSCLPVCVGGLCVCARVLAANLREDFPKRYVLKTLNSFSPILRLCVRAFVLACLPVGICGAVCVCQRACGLARGDLANGDEGFPKSHDGKPFNFFF